MGIGLLAVPGEGFLVPKRDACEEMLSSFLLVIAETG